MRNVENKIMRNKGLLILSISLFFIACEKEIELDYHTVEPIYVVEGEVNQTGSSVKVTTTRDITSNDRAAHVVEGAVVVLTSELGLVDTLRQKVDGRYTSKVFGIPGIGYTLDVDVEGHHFQAKSTMQQKPQVADFQFVWRKVMGEEFLFADLRLQDFPGENNYYFMHFYRNYKGYRWAVMRDTQDPGGELRQLFNCSSRRAMEEGNNSDALREDDFISVEVRNIDRQTYDYFYSMQQMNNTGTNPIEIFTGGCLGYFSAYGVTNYDCYFHEEDVVTE